MARNVVAVVVDHLRRDRLNRGWAGSPPFYHLVRRQLGFFTFPLLDVTLCVISQTQNFFKLQLTLFIYLMSGG